MYYTVLEYGIVLFVTYSLPGKIKFWSEQSFYKAGDMLIASCTSPPSRPPSVLTFLINNKTTTQSKIIKRLDEIVIPTGQ
ncbi:hypothetical protein M8J75_013935 [Diaphorina citri]|nr:hypothetical protein M8J75_013935 [Diaphorina citri]